MRKLLATMAVLAGLVVSAPQAGAETDRDVPGAVASDPFLLLCVYPYPGPAGWQRVGYQFRSCERCRESGEAGVSRGDWPEYRCAWFPAGLDIVYYLFVPPAP
jgi:hypothetical protein